ncbi:MULTISPECIES: TetR/AcrR family transcriptional regulator [unclassified Rhodanobacter]|uniref:TetR/AcrR family transcriptional regulator n=1 Tax=unclassified Rhodanobacter TaxID=2621553 RepID=UPI001BE0CC84|nr:MULTISPECIES: TetR/AcrR family transcriptional regulator [unclassified Rhodanobacter]MBT2145199.1 TetR/AcrR family transcriptional regulator [Rhodanobacter sp. LX-99]MBT2149244.1 TetR/AcrR family transcriptional regulator [Rhodanobacter sp. LX-100]
MATSTKRAKAGRRAGRPSGDDLDLRARLLDAAIAQFARVGIGATPLRAIASEAEVTPAMLHYYFGDKPRLVQALVEERLLPALAPLRVQLEQVGDDPRVLIETFVRGIGEVVARHPWLPPLWVREVLCDGGALREVLFAQAVPGVPQLLARRFAAAQADGRLNADLDPRLLVVSLVGLTLFPAAGAPIWRRAFGAEGLGPEAMLRHTLALLDRGAGAAGSGETA